LTFAASGRARWAVFFGAAAALVATSALAVLAGAAVARAVPPAFLKRAAGVAFVAIGLWVLWSSRSGGG
jgi:putative Ca2+/H+ antiporter (TMEM165/GDT1 family)